MTLVCISVAADMEQVHLVMVLPSQEALDRLKAPEVDFEPDDATTDEVRSRFNEN